MRQALLRYYVHSETLFRVELLQEYIGLPKFVYDSQGDLSTLKMYFRNSGKSILRAKER